MNPFAMAPGPGLGDYVAARFNEPDNPFALTRASAGLGCLGCLGQTTAAAPAGDLVIGGVDLTAMWSQISSYQVGGIPVVYLAGGAAVLLLLLQQSSTGSLQKQAGRLTNKARYLRSKVKLRQGEG